MDATALGDAMSAYMPESRRNLDRLVRIPSVSFPEYDQSHVRRSAEATAEILEPAGLRDVRLIEIEGGNPAVYGDIPAAEDAPTARTRCGRATGQPTAGSTDVSLPTRCPS